MDITGLLAEFLFFPHLCWQRTWHDFSGDILVVEDLWTSRDWLLSVSHYTAEKGIILHRNFQWMQSLSRFFED
ncbi:Leucine--tRNA ligase [Frankliniella fusca]|uniref:Leucine--tRNA ligase n=1 Tax=Frankliniella fusca TaxID=407009 RepID=A0AAE1LHF8_9NEOP|nr:Leucine--tRNA ligase [Frankliniella fusca]